MSSASLPFPSPPLEAAGLVLRPLAASDYGALESFRDDPETARWVNAIPVANGAELIAGSEELRAAGRLVHLAITETPTDRLLGEIVLWSRTPEMAEAETGEIAYVVDPAQRGRGIASTAVKLLSEWAFEALGLKRLQLSIAPENVASARVAEKAGYRFEGTLRSVKVIRGRRIDVQLYSRLPDDP